MGADLGVRRLTGPLCNTAWGSVSIEKSQYLEHCFNSWYGIMEVSFQVLNFSYENP